MERFKYETQGGMPTLGLTLEQISDELIKLQKLFILAGHLEADNDQVVSHGFLGCAEIIKKLQYQVSGLIGKKVRTN